MLNEGFCSLECRRWFEISNCSLGKTACTLEKIHISRHIFFYSRERQASADDPGCVGVLQYFFFIEVFDYLVIDRNYDLFFLFASGSSLCTYMHTALLLSLRTDNGKETLRPSSENKMMFSFLSPDRPLCFFFFN